MKNVAYHLLYESLKRCTSDRRRIADRVAAQEIALFCLKRFLIIVLAIFGGFKAGFSLGACDLS